MPDKDFSWVRTHKELTRYLTTQEDNQKELIELLKSVGISPFNDKSREGKDFDIELEEIDPFTFFCYINKYGSKRRIKKLRRIAEKLDLSIPNGDYGIPSAQPQRVWMFPYNYLRKNNEIKRLWVFFKKTMSDQLTDDDFEDVLKIRNVGRTKLTESLFYVDPEKYLPINGPTKPYLKEVLKINPTFNTYQEYLAILEQIKIKNNLPFYELSYKAWKWENERKDKAQSEVRENDSIELYKESSSIKYWLYSPGKNGHKWEEFYEEGIMGLGWDEMGDLNQYKNRDELAEAFVKIYGRETSGANSILANEEFKNSISIGDVIIVKKGRNELLGYGTVTSDYYYDSERDDFKKCRKVDWKKKGSWSLNFQLVTKTLTDITNYGTEDPKYEKYFQRLLGYINRDSKHLDSYVKHPLNTIFYGPPGTGKTYSTIRRAAEIIENRKIDSYEEAIEIYKNKLHDQIEMITFHQNYSYEDFIQGLRPDTESDGQLSFEKKDGIFKVIADQAMKNIKDSKQAPVLKKSFAEVFREFTNPLIEGETEEIEVKMKKVSFFITAITNKSIEFRKASGGTNHTLSISALKEMYERESIPDPRGFSSYYNPLLEKLLKIGIDSSGKREIVPRKNYVIIIDEINRANISRVFGELITLIEPDKRSHGSFPMKVKLPSGDSFMVPSNLYIIGTMNTADKSIALLDIALRRRFEFEAMYPQYDIPDHTIYDVDILQKLNEEIIKTKGHDFQIGHSYFMDENKDLVPRMNQKVIPLLLEYYMNDEKQVKTILNSAGLIIEENAWPIKITGKKP